MKIFAPWQFLTQLIEFVIMRVANKVFRTQRVVQKTSYRPGNRNTIAKFRARQFHPREPVSERIDYWVWQTSHSSQPAKVDSPDEILSLAPTRVNSRSWIPILPCCRYKRTRLCQNANGGAVWRGIADLPLMLGPVIIKICCWSPSIKISFGIKDSPVGIRSTGDDVLDHNLSPSVISGWTYWNCSAWNNKTNRQSNKAAVRAFFCNGIRYACHFQSVLW